MYFLVHKFSEWLTLTKINHTVSEIKGGWIIQFIDPPDGFTSIIKSILIPITSNDGKTDFVNSFTCSGDLVIEEQYTAEIINTLHPAIRNYMATVYNRGSLG